MEKICFIHIPKCGGTSIRSSIKKNWFSNFLKRGVSLDSPASSKAADIVGKEVLAYREELLIYLLMSKNNYVFGHFRCTEATRQLFSDQWKFVTLIRDPVKRWFSHYYFDRYRDEKKMMKTEMGMLDYLNSTEGFRNSRMLVRHFSKCDDYHNVTPQHVEEAIRNILSFDAYGILERSDLFAESYQKATKVKLKIPYKNKNPKKNYTKDVVSPEVLEQVTELCSFDTQIYQAVKEAALSKERSKN